MKSQRLGGPTDREGWEAFAVTNGWDYIADPLRPRMKGTRNDCSAEAVATILRMRHKGSRSESARTNIRVSIRAETPPGLVIEKKSFSKAIAGLMLRLPAIAIDRDIDAFFRVRSHDPVAAHALLTDIEVKKALLRLIDVLPESVITERALEVWLDGMVPADKIDRLLDVMTAVAAAMRACAPQRTMHTTPDRTPRPLPSAAELPPTRRSLSGAVKRLGSGHKLNAIQVAALKVAPHEFEVEVTSVSDAFNRLGGETGGRMVRGHVLRSHWKAEINFEESHNPVCDDLQAGDIITGLVEVDGVRAIGRIIECRALTLPIRRRPES